MKKILVAVAHPDDESLYFAQGIYNLSRQHEVHVLCVTHKRESTRGREFQLACSKLNTVAVFLEAQDNGFESLIPGLTRLLRNFLTKHHFDQIITHAPDGGEKPHPHHIQIFCSLCIILKLMDNGTELLFFTEKNKFIHNKIYIYQLYFKLIKRLKTKINIQYYPEHLWILIRSLFNEPIDFIPSESFDVDYSLKTHCLVSHQSQLEVLSTYSTAKSTKEYLWVQKRKTNAVNSVIGRA